LEKNSKILDTLVETLKFPKIDNKEINDEDNRIFKTKRSFQEIEGLVIKGIIEQKNRARDYCDYMIPNKVKEDSNVESNIMKDVETFLQKEGGFSKSKCKFVDNNYESKTIKEILISKLRKQNNRMRNKKNIEKSGNDGDYDFVENKPINEGMKCLQQIDNSGYSRKEKEQSDELSKKRIKGIKSNSNIPLLNTKPEVINQGKRENIIGEYNLSIKGNKVY